MNDGERPDSPKSGAVYGFVAILGVMSMASGPLCTADMFDPTHTEKHQATWCFEFWLNRYQLVLGGTGSSRCGVGGMVNRDAARFWGSDEALEVARRQTAAAALEHIVARLSLTNDAVRAVEQSEEAISDLHRWRFNILIFSANPDGRDNLPPPEWLTQKVYIQSLDGCIGHLEFIPQKSNRFGKKLKRLRVDGL